LDLIKEIHQFLEIEIDEVNKLILESLSVEEELVRLVSNYISKSGGKRIRPVLTLLSSKIFNCKNDNRIKLAAAVEFIHMATLLHDDVVDGSKMRRCLPSANVVWGSKASILVGDFLFSQSFKLIVSSGSVSAMSILAEASAVIAEGEVSQLAKLEEHRLITEDEYFKVINAKTAALFGAACEVGAVIADESSDYCRLLRNFGRKLGSIFQITDDLLDYFDEAKATGKNIGDDFAEGKVTLPIIFLANKLPTNDRKNLVDLITLLERTPDDFKWVKQLLIKFNIKDEIVEYLQDLKIETNQLLDEINIEIRSKEYLKLLVDFAINRNY